MQDRQAFFGADQSRVERVDQLLGNVHGGFKVDVQLPGFTVNFGDIDVSPVTGNLLIASSDETSLAEFKPDGTFVQLHVLPSGIGSISGLGVVEGGNGAWVSSTSGLVYRLGNFPWTSLGNALPGTAGQPKLMGSSSQVAGAPSSLNLVHAKDLALAYLVVGLTTVNLPFKGGKLVPSFDVFLGPLGTAGGFADLAFAWPAGLPSGFALNYQMWIADPAGPRGFAASNAIRSVTP